MPAFSVSATSLSLPFNQFGGSLGGPIKRNRIFVCAAEGYRESASTFVEGNVPTVLARQELLQAVPDYKLALQAFPLPNSPTAPDALVGDFSATKQEIHSDNHYDVRSDFVITDNSRLTVTYNRGSPHWVIPRYYIDDPRST